jgi:hypothetical protein
MALQLFPDGDLMQLIAVVGHDGDVAIGILGHVMRDHLGMSARSFCIREFDADRVLETDAVDNGKMKSWHASISFSHAGRSTAA